VGKKGYKIVSGGKRKRPTHKCELPGVFGTFRLELGTIVECTFCGKRYEKELDYDGLDVFWREVK